MDQNQKENLKQLIVSTHALATTEKNEWLALLDLMDDRQLSELKDILDKAEGRFGQTRKVLPPLEASAAAPQTPAIQPTPNKPEASASQPLKQALPKLSHILNIPRIGADKKVEADKKPETVKQIPTLNLLAAKPTIGPALPVGTFTEKVAEKKPSKMMQRIRDILAEKELPAPQKVVPLELPAPQKVIAAVKPAPVPPKPPLPKVFPSVSLSSKPMPPKIPLVKPVVAPVKGNLVRPETKPSQFKPVLPQGPSMKQQSGLTFARSSNEDKEKILEEIKRDLQQKKHDGPATVSINAQNVNILPGSVSINSLDDLEELSPKVFSYTGSDTLARRIKSLVAKNGYHPVIFSIEKSPLYQSYIKTGAEVLNNKISFGALEDNQSDDYLNKESFESCIDLLRQIQSS